MKTESPVRYSILSNLGWAVIGQEKPMDVEAFEGVKMKMDSERRMMEKFEGKSSCRRGCQIYFWTRS